MGFTEAVLSVAGLTILLAWMLDSRSRSKLIERQNRHIERLYNQLNLMKLAGAVDGRHQYVGMQSLTKMYRPPEEPEPEPEPEPESEPEPSAEGLEIRGSFAY